MTEDLSLDSINTELQFFLKSKARNLPHPTRSLVFKLDNKNNLKITDSDKKSYEVQEFFLESFRQHFSNPNYKYVKIYGWDFQIELDLVDRKCSRIILNADHIVFIQNKNNKYELKDIAFRTVVATAESIEEFSKQAKGFVRRIVKKHVLGSAENVNQEFFSLISFVKRAQDLKIERLTNIAEQKKPEEHPMDYLTPQGIQIIEKLRGFITKQDLFDFLVRQQLSSSCETQLKSIVLSQASLPQGKKKRVKAE